MITGHFEAYQQDNTPTPSKLITLGTSYKDISGECNDANTIFTEIQETNDLLKNCIEWDQSIIKTIKMLTIAGEIGDAIGLECFIRKIDQVAS